MLYTKQLNKNHLSLNKSIALIDCNNFYASCERIFNPKLIGKSIVVLSNNDGCIIARSNEAKALGIPMGAPLHLWKDLIKKNRVIVYSSNYTLYGDMSSRVMNSFYHFTPDVEVYSIDEAFLGLDGFNKSNIYKKMIFMKKKIYQWTGIPVSIGIGPTKTPEAYSGTSSSATRSSPCRIINPQPD